MKREMKRNERKMIVFPKMFENPPNPPDELAQHVSKKNLFRTNYSSIFSSKVQNLTVFSIIYMIRIRFFGPQELIQKHFRAARYPVDFAGSWTPPEYWDAGDIALEMSEHPNIWTDGG